MPLKTSQLNSVQAEFDWEYRIDKDLVETIHVVYNPQGYTPALERKISEAMQGDYKSESSIVMLKSMLLDWDLVTDELDEEGNPTGKDVPLGVSNEALATLPIKFLSDAVIAISEEIQAVSEGNPSGDGSPQKVSSVPLPTGTR